jgi:tyrosine-protein kinase Etk/Wzc
MENQEKSQYLIPKYLEGLQEDKVSVMKLFRKYVLSKWYVYAVSCAIFFGIGYYYIKSSPSVYEISAQLLINEKETNYSSGEDWLKENLDLYSVSGNVTNEAQILSSFSLMQSVVEDLELDIRYYWKEKLSPREAFQNFPFEVDSLYLNPLDNTSFEVRPLSQETFELIHDDKSIGKYQFGQLFSNSLGNFKLVKKFPLPLNSDASLHFEYLDPRKVTQNYLKSYTVTFSDVKKKSSILKLTLEDVSPERGEAILGNLIEKYNEIKQEENNRQSIKKLTFINDRLEKVSTELKTVENNLKQYKLSNNIPFESTSDLDLLLTNVNELSQEQKDLEVQINIVQSMKQNLGQSNNQYELIPLNLSLINAQIQDLIKPYNELVLKREQLLLTSQPSNPLVQSVNQDLKSLKPSIFSALENMEKDLALQLEASEKQFESFSKRLKSVPVKEKELLDQSRKQSISEDLYVYLLKKKEETALALVGEFSNSKVVDPPRSSIEPVAPSKLRIMLMAMMLGGGLPLFVFITLGMISDSIQTEKELKNLLPNITVMGTICRYNGKEKQVVFKKGRTITSEHFRTLRTKLQFHFPMSPKSIMVTSSNSGEGKTFVAMNLALSYALSKKKTIVIDFDLHRPDLDINMEEKVKIGLGDYLSGNAELKDIIFSSKTASNLDFITSGKVIPNSSELITDTGKLDDLFSYLKDRYEIIIVDTAPVGIISDAILLKKYITTTLYIIRSGHTKKEIIDNASELFKREVLANPTLLLNGVKATHYYDYQYKKYVV